MGTPEDTPPLKSQTTTSLTLTHAIREVQQPKRKRFPFLTRHSKTTATVSAPRIPDSAPTLPTQSPPPPNYKHVQTGQNKYRLPWARNITHLKAQSHASINKWIPYLPRSRATKRQHASPKRFKTNQQHVDEKQHKSAHTKRATITTSIEYTSSAQHAHVDSLIPHHRITSRKCHRRAPPQNPYTTQGPTTVHKSTLTRISLCAHSSPWPPHVPSARYAIVELVRSRAFLTLAERGSDIKARRCNRYILATITTVPTKLLIDRQTLSGRENP